ncbi:DUF6123 family protein [Cytobacillus spongiae]|uniref:DUF6123 family protein n=1 Tax=Cytobacillus spongiae TaxID=2901381 RepID=UPI001F2AA576|nr:DUF6123 family protein [Cytobacillus spongiae]UII57940.1 DUF6123 family protein [Cytobacillus spongiae]
MQTVEEYLRFLQSKGFQFQEDAIGFIYFGKHYTSASDELINTAIEFTLKAQRTFDGSFYISLLETFVSNKVKTRKQAFQLVKDRQIIGI